MAAGLSQAQVGDPRLAAAIYLVGGVFFTTGAGFGIALTARGSLDRAGAAVLFVGTLYFFASLLAALLGDLTLAQEHRLVWSPEVVGCVLFLLSGQIALTVVWRGRGEVPSGLWSELDWWIAVVNQLGSVLFMVAAVAAWVRPQTGDALAVGVANWGTLTGALCFAVAGAMQGFERPD